MKALVKRNAGVGLEMEDVPMPEIGPTDVLIRIRKTSVCGKGLRDSGKACVTCYHCPPWARRQGCSMIRTR